MGLFMHRVILFKKFPATACGRALPFLFRVPALRASDPPGRADPLHPAGAAFYIGTWAALFMNLALGENFFSVTGRDLLTAVPDRGSLRLPRSLPSRQLPGCKTGCPSGYPGIFPGISEGNKKREECTRAQSGPDRRRQDFSRTASFTLSSDSS